VHTPKTTRRRATNELDATFENGGAEIQLLLGHVKEVHSRPDNVKAFKRMKTPKTYPLFQVLFILFASIHNITFRNSHVLKNFLLSVVPFILLIVIDIVNLSPLTALDPYHLNLHACDNSNRSDRHLNYFLHFRLGLLLFLPICQFNRSICRHPLRTFSLLLTMFQVIVCKPFFYRFFVYTNALACMTNTLALMIAECVQEEKKPFFIVVVVLQFITKIVLAQLVSLQIAYFKNPKFYLNQAKLDSVLIEVVEEGKEGDEINLVLADDANKSVSTD